MEICQHVFVDDMRNGVTVCNICGVAKPIFNAYAEWRNPDQERCDTVAAWYSDASSNVQAGTSISGNGLLSKMNRSLTRYSRTIEEDKFRIEELCHHLNLSKSVCLGAVNMMCDVRRNGEGVWRGNRRIALRAACLSITCRNMNVGISDREIVGHASVNLPIKCLNKQKKMIIMMQHAHKSTTIISGEQYTEFGRRFCSRLGFDCKLTDVICRKADSLARKPRLQSKQSNMILAVTVIHVIRASTLVSTEDLCQVTGVTHPTLTKWYADAYRISYADARDVLRQMQQ
jgi:transcription initiation factor TFIIIB Brf1 subunit/transcription initiation factor TFIIB